MTTVLDRAPDSLRLMGDQDDQGAKRREQVRAAQARYRARHKEKVAERRAAWYAENGREYHLAWRERNRDLINARQNARRAADPEKAREYSRDRWPIDWAASLKSKYGLTVDEYHAMADAQDCRCALCGRDGNVGGKRLAVDHCHKTGRVRGLLCNPCNTALGNVRDNVDLLMKMAEYVLAHQNVLESE